MVVDGVVELVFGLDLELRETFGDEDLVELGNKVCEFFEGFDDIVELILFWLAQAIVFEGFELNLSCLNLNGRGTWTRRLMALLKMIYLR